MIATGATLSRLAHGNFAALLSVAALDIALATALLSSSVIFWTHGLFGRRTEPTAA